MTLLEILLTGFAVQTGILSLVLRWTNRRQLRMAHTKALRRAIRDLQALQPARPHHHKEISVTAPTPNFVQIDQNDLDTFATAVSDAVTVLGPYIQQLLAGQAVTLAPADETAVQAALAALQGLEPPAPAPAPDPTPDPTPAPDAGV